MDNEAFRALVQERARVKSTKEIAREAVEEEFQTRKKKRRHGGGSSSEGEGSDDSDRDEQQKSQDLLVPAVARKKARSSESNYRDRAKERREGKNVDYAAQASLLEGLEASAQDGDMDQATLSKYLGGDEAHTHLVKGLDVALARKVKSEMGTGSTVAPDLDNLMDEIMTKSRKHEFVQDADEALSLLQRINPRSISSELGRAMLDHLKDAHLPSRPLSQRHVRKSPAGYSIQNSTLTFSVLGDPRDKSRAWEIPLESTHASSHIDPSAAGAVLGATHLDAILLEKIRNALSPKEPENTDSTSVIVGVEASADINQENFKGRSNEKVTEEDDDDDDIFADVGDYLPPTESADNQTRPSETKVKTGSIFAGLVAPKPPSPAISASMARARPAVVNHSKERAVIDRDLLGSRPNVALKKQPTGGTAISSYDGGYGEEMDVDFDGRFAAEEEGDNMKKGGKEETTLAALEYGAGRGKSKLDKLRDQL